ncbi:hypothetical protein [Flavobacterium xinjiangense]|uniref:Uncharacterized protein n=1 Tax=Flavobacterium xinjiangense TaxID=178356 RepID=A0A1M7L296_9FLAO|nr:hypothetical protein [Flavobacterium xinjiangense]SHM71995.1 hypothetical protein SAMN05216269_106159 [Flavobacterium xinjiangense]
MKSLIGLTGIGLVQGTALIPTNGLPLAEIVKIAIQVVIGIASIIHMFKKPKEVISNQNTTI